MASSLIRGKYVICKVNNRNDAHVIEDGAVFQRDGVIVEVGKFEALSKKHRADDVLGSDQHVVLPGFVNSHHHVGLLAFQMGTPDLALEQWTMDRLRKRDVDPYLDTLYSAFEMIESGITTVQHLHNRATGPLERVYQVSNKVIKAYRDIGMRVSYSFGLRDQNRMVLRGGRGLSQTPAGRSCTRGRRAAERPGHSARGQFFALRAALPRTQSRRAHAHPAPAGESALVLRQGARDDAGLRRQVSGARAHAPARDEISEGLRAAAQRRHRGQPICAISACSGRT